MAGVAGRGVKALLQLSNFNLGPDMFDRLGLNVNLKL